MTRKFLAAGAAAAFVFVVNVEMALAQDGGAGKVGENLGNVFSSWAKNIYVGVAALVAILFLINRKFVDLAIFLVAAIIVGGFVLAPGDVADVVTGFWKTLTTGV